MTNEGTWDTDDVVQIYIKNTVSEYSVKNPALCAFKRVHVKAGQSVEILLTIAGREFTVVNDRGERMSDGTEFELYVGTAQPDARSIELTGKPPVKIKLKNFSNVCG